MLKIAIQETLSSRNVTYNAFIIRIIKMQETESWQLRRKLNIVYRQVSIEAHRRRHISIAVNRFKFKSRKASNAAAFSRAFTARNAVALSRYDESFSAQMTTHKPNAICKKEGTQRKFLEPYR